MQHLRQSSRLRAALSTALLLGVVSIATAQAPDPAKIEYRREKVTENLSVLFGAGGNIAVLTGPDGTLVVDSDVTEMSAKLRAAVAMVSDKPARFLVNTHFHFDHTGGNTMFGRTGTVIVAQDNALRHLVAEQVINIGNGVEMKTPPTTHEGLPVVTFADGIRFHLDDEEVVVRHVANGHTDSDAFVFFEKANVLHTGDLMMSIGYPIVDRGNGGSLDGLIAGHERALALCNDQTRVIPGHGALVGKADLQAYHDMLVVIRKRVGDQVRKGRTLEQVQASAPSKEFDERWGKGFFDGKTFVQRVYVELKEPPKDQKKGQKPG